eukprot:TRINITY_DN6486_c0_g1_i1.p1 TRINITY_DN6486_c0_g1~~TRINITY_DN6486_c0_g1_i1.p1  ORF type:complete len:169 (+),score=16.57 TRINITY_DN6486_c0_g1_i1:142-648(+)
MTICPGKVQPYAMTGISWDRNTTKDLQVLKEKYGCNVLVSLMELREIKNLKTEIIEQTPTMDMKHYLFEWRDGDIPSENTWTTTYKKLLIDVASEVMDGKVIVVHCMGGLGRTGTFVSNLLQYLLKIEIEDAIDLTRRSRRGTIKQPHQCSWLENTMGPMVAGWITEQ